MRAYLEKLANDEQRADFERLCLQEMEKVYRPDDQGKVLFPFKRIFIVAYRKTLTTEDTKEHKGLG